MAKAAKTPTEEVAVPPDAPQIQPDYAPDAVTLTDNRRSDYDQPNLINPDSEKVTRNAMQDGMDNQNQLIRQTEDSGSSAKNVKTFKDHAEAIKHIGKPVSFQRAFGVPSEAATLMYVGEKDAILSNGMNVPYNTLSEVDPNAPHPFEGNPAYDINVKHGSDTSSEAEDKKIKAKREDKATS